MRGRLVRPLWWLALGGGAMALVVVVQQVVLLFLLVSVGGAGVELANVLAAVPAGLGLDVVRPSYDLLVIAMVSAIPVIALLGWRQYRASGGRGASLVISAAALPLLLAMSYRLPALVAAAAFALSIRRLAYRERPRRVSWALLVTCVVLACLPVDVSLRRRPRGAHFARAVSGLLMRPPIEIDANGDTVVVGSCGAIYNEPTWVWVW
jgi:hypothetical protein